MQIHWHWKKATFAYDEVYKPSVDLNMLLDVRDLYLQSSNVVLDFLRIYIASPKRKQRFPRHFFFAYRNRSKTKYIVIENGIT